MSGFVLYTTDRFRQERERSMHPLTPDQLEYLEMLIDEHNLDVVLDGLASICHEKAEHVRSNWQDKAGARAWTANAKAIERIKLHTV